jgi:hypothetical protein
MTQHEAFIQQQVVDAAAYRRVFDSLNQEPDFALSSKFEERILQAIQANEKVAERTASYWIVAGVVVLIMASIIGAVLVGFKPSFGAFGFLSRYVGLFVFGVAFISLLQWLDRKIVHRPSF